MDLKTVTRWTMQGDGASKNLLKSWNSLHRTKHKRRQDQGGGTRAFNALLHEDGITYENLHDSSGFWRALQVLFDQLTPEGGDLLGVERIVEVAFRHFGADRASVEDTLAYVLVYGDPPPTAARFTHFAAWLVYMLGDDDKAYSGVIEMTLAVREMDVKSLPRGVKPVPPPPRLDAALFDVPRGCEHSILLPYYHIWTYNPRFYSLIMSPGDVNTPAELPQSEGADFIGEDWVVSSEAVARQHPHTTKPCQRTASGSNPNPSPCSLCVLCCAVLAPTPTTYPPLPLPQAARQLASNETGHCARCTNIKRCQRRCSQAGSLRGGRDPMSIYSNYVHIW
jgi:hypothetical protein